MPGELLFSVTKKDLEISTFSGSGAGGQYRNRHPNCVRITHRASGVSVTGTEQRSMDQNKRMAFRRLTQHPRFVAWLRMEACRRASGKGAIENAVDREMDPKNLMVETMVNGAWAREPCGSALEVEKSQK